MKLRNGFVSNSSSSSFVVAFDKLPKSATEVKQLLFGDAKEWSADGMTHPAYTFPTEVLADVVWGNIQAQKHKLPYSRDCIAGEMDNLAYLHLHYPDDDGMYKEDDWYRMEDGPEKDAAREKENQKLNELRDKLADEFLQENEGKVIMTFIYADENGSLGLVMEHGQIFRNCRRVRINNH